MQETVPDELYYTKNHEWLMVDENLVTFGLTAHGATFLGEILYLDLPEDGQKPSVGQAIGTIESVRKIHDLFSPISGTILELNHLVLEDPSIINDDPLGEGWLFRIELDDEKDLANLLRSKGYKDFIKESNRA